LSLAGIGVIEMLGKCDEQRGKWVICIKASSRWVHSQKKRYKSCHWGGTFSKDTLLYLKGAYWYLNGINMYYEEPYDISLKR